MREPKSTQPSTNNSDNLSNDHSQKSEEAKGSLINAAESTDFLRQQIRELHEKLIFANETIAIMEDQREAGKIASV